MLRLLFENYFFYQFRLVIQKFGCKPNEVKLLYLTMEGDDSFFAVKHPAEPPIEGGSYDEDSFVVLGSSSFKDDDVSLNDEVLTPIRSGKIHEMQNSIKTEISKVNNSTSGSIPDMPAAVDPLSSGTCTVANITSSPDASYEEIQKQVESLIKENEELKNLIAQNNLSMKTQYDRIVAWKEEVNNVMQSYKTKFIEAKSYLDKAKEENNKLANDVEKYKKIKELQDEEIINFKRIDKERENLGDVSNSAEQNMVQFDLQIANEKIKDLQTELAEANIKNSEYLAEKQKLLDKLIKMPELEEELENQEKEINNLKTQLQSYLDQILKLKNEKDLEIKKNEQLDEKISTLPSHEMKSQQNEIEIDRLSQENKEKQAKINSLLEENANLLIDLQKQKQIYNPEFLESYDRVCQQLRNSQLTITALEEDKRSKIKEIDELRRLIQSSSKSDEIYDLNEQLNLFKHDFEAEKESKDSIKRERDQIAEDLKNLQKRNKQLQDEIRKLRPNAEGFICPKCSFGFNTYQSLENHVHRCLDLDDFP